MDYFGIAGLSGALRQAVCQDPNGISQRRVQLYDYCCAFVTRSWAFVEIELYQLTDVWRTDAAYGRPSQSGFCRVAPDLAGV